MLTQQSYHYQVLYHHILLYPPHKILRAVNVLCLFYEKRLYFIAHSQWNVFQKMKFYVGCSKKSRPGERGFLVFTFCSALVNNMYIFIQKTHIHVHVSSYYHNYYLVRFLEHIIVIFLLLCKFSS